MLVWLKFWSPFYFSFLRDGWLSADYRLVLFHWQWLVSYQGKGLMTRVILGDNLWQQCGGTKWGSQHLLAAHTFPKNWIFRLVPVSAYLLFLLCSIVEWICQDQIHGCWYVLDCVQCHWHARCAKFHWWRFVDTHQLHHRSLWWPALWIWIPAPTRSGTSSRFLPDY